MPSAVAKLPQFSAKTLQDLQDPAAKTAFQELEQYIGSLLSLLAQLEEDSIEDGTVTRAKIDDSQAIERFDFTVASPSGSEEHTLFYTTVAITLTKVRAVLRGSSSPSITYRVRHDPDRSASGNAATSSGTTVTSTTTGADATLDGDPTIPADSWVWLEITGSAGTVDEYALALEFDKDA